MPGYTPNIFKHEQFVRQLQATQVANNEQMKMFQPQILQQMQQQQHHQQQQQEQFAMWQHQTTACSTYVKFAKER